MTCSIPSFGRSRAGISPKSKKKPLATLRCHATNPVRLKPGGLRGRWPFATIEPFNSLNTVMSLHRSLRAASTSGKKRNVLKRYERVEILKRRSQWKAGDRVTGLRKTKPDA